VVVLWMSLAVLRSCLRRVARNMVGSCLGGIWRGAMVRVMWVCLFRRRCVASFLWARR